MVVFDRSEGHNNLIYFNADRSIKVIVTADFNRRRLKPKEQVDAVINAYKVEDFDMVLNAIKGGVYVVLKGKP
ncbi:Uncharacterised protein [Aggregatibacter aphrophilus]|uniref:Uncharacterized protein n=1 Tax=Aggregatibacter aphrophilus TaxID=732 RepID=A0A336N4Q4_AGGAP|nr:Uncharacterised protein [Aggregatibacter aphrophilus]